MRVLGIARYLVRHGVVSAPAQGVTAHQAAQAEPRASQGTVTLDGGMRVAGTARVKAAAWTQPGTQEQLISPDEPQQNLSEIQHRCEIAFQCLSKLARNSCSAAWRAASRADTVTSTGGREC
jgi:hypothetical protein